MKCYISGKISGLLSEQVTAKFRQAEQQDYRQDQR